MVSERVNGGSGVGARRIVVAVIDEALSRVSSSPLAIGDGSVTAASILITRWRSTASLKRKPPVSSPSVLLSHSMFIRT